MSYANQAAASHPMTESKSRVTTSLEDARSAMADLERAIEQMEKRLLGVLGPCEASKSPVDRPTRSEEMLADNILALADRAHESREKVERILARLEL